MSYWAASTDGWPTPIPASQLYSGAGSPGSTSPADRYGPQLVLDGRASWLPWVSLRVTVGASSDMRCSRAAAPPARRATGVNARHGPLGRQESDAGANPSDESDATVPPGTSRSRQPGTDPLSCRTTAKRVGRMTSKSSGPPGGGCVRDGRAPNVCGSAMAVGTPRDTTRRTANASYWRRRSSLDPLEDRSGPPDRPRPPGGSGAKSSEPSSVTDWPGAGPHVAG